MPKRSLNTMLHDGSPTVVIDDDVQINAKSQDDDVHNKNKNIRGTSNSRRLNNNQSNPEYDQANKEDEIMVDMQFYLLGANDKSLPRDGDELREVDDNSGSSSSYNNDNGVGNDQLSVYALDTSKVDEDQALPPPSSSQEDKGASSSRNPADFSVYMLPDGVASNHTDTAEEEEEEEEDEVPDHIQKLHLTLKNYADDLKKQKELALGNHLGHVHSKTSFVNSIKEGSHKENKDNKPIRWNGPNPEELDGVEEAPRVPYGGGSSSEDMDGMIYCKSDRGKFGQLTDGAYGVVIRYQYEMTVDDTVEDSANGLNSLLPQMETAMTDITTATFFNEECLPPNTSGEKVGVTGRDLLQLGEDGEKEEGEGEEGEMVLVPAVSSNTGSSGGGLRNMKGQRRLAKVVGIDSAPRDFPLDSKGEFYFFLYLGFRVCVVVFVISPIVVFSNHLHMPPTPSSPFYLSTHPSLHCRMSILPPH